MFNRPSSRRKSQHTSIELNLVPILDTMVTLIGFLLFTSSFLHIVSIESPLPQTAPGETLAHLKDSEKPLQLTLSLEDNQLTLSSPFERIPRQSIPHKDHSPDLYALHEALLAIKRKFPKEVDLVLIPAAVTPYHSLISLMDTARSFDPTDPPLYFKSEDSDVERPLKTLFPKIIFGNLLDSAAGTL